MEHSFVEEWPLDDMEIVMGQDDDFLEQCYTVDDELFLRDILEEPAFFNESENQSLHNPSHHSNIAPNNFIPITTVTNMKEDLRKKPRHSSTPRTYILSFDNSTIIPATPEPCLANEKMGTRSSSSSNKSNNNNNNSPPLSSKKVTMENRNVEPKQKANQGGKKNRNDSQTMEHIMAERRRRQELTEKFIALSATIPDLKKTDKASVLREAINYVKQLQERVLELEKCNKESIVLLNKTEMFVDEGSTSSETSSKESELLLPDVEAKVLGNEVLVEIHCEKENGIENEILNHLENFHLCVNGISALPFGSSTLGITIIAQMGDAYNMTVNELVKNLRHVLIESHTLICNNIDPF